jgi:flagellar assembly factor FliW
LRANKHVRTQYVPADLARRAAVVRRLPWRPAFMEERVQVMEVLTTRFGIVDVEPGDVLLFPAGMLGLDDCQHWVLLADAENAWLGWLQSTTHADVALAVVVPRRFVPEYDVRVPRSELAPLALTDADDAQVLVVVGKNDHNTITLNLKAPLILNLRRRLGRQVIHNGTYPLQYEPGVEMPRRKVA